MRHFYEGKRRRLEEMVRRFSLASLLGLTAFAAVLLSWFLHQHRLSTRISQQDAEIAKLNWQVSAIHGSWEERRDAIKELSGHATLEDAPNLILGLHDPDLEVARTAHNALCRIANNDKRRLGKSAVERLETIAYWCNWYPGMIKERRPSELSDDPFGDDRSSVTDSAISELIADDPFKDFSGTVGTGPVRGRE